MSRARSRTIETLIQLVCIVLLLALLIGVLLFEASRHAQDWSGEQARLATVADTYRATAYFFREEQPVVSVDNGAVLYQAANGSEISEGSVVATVYADGANAGTRGKAAELIAKIDRLERALSEASPDYYGAYRDLMASLSLGAVPADHTAQGVLLDALDKREALAKKAEYEAQIAALREELRVLISNDAGAFGNTLSPCDGRFYRTCDGYESVMTLAALNTLTAGGLRALLASPQGTGTAIGKIVSGTACYAAFTMPAAACKLVQGTAYSALLERSGVSVTATVDRVSDVDSDGSVLVVLSITGMGAAADLLRAEEIVITCATATGISLPSSAVHEEDGGTLVAYVAKDGVAVRCVLEPLYWQNGCLLVAEGTGEAGLRVGDTVIVTVRRVYDGKVLK